ncbi:MAG: nucleoside deaminase, partial [Variovorax sp.]
MSVDARYVFDHGQKPVELIGPVPEVVEETVAMQRAFWSHR